MGTMMFPTRRVTLVVLLVIASQLALLTNVQWLKSMAGGSWGLDGSVNDARLNNNGNKFFRVELIPNSPDKPFYQASKVQDYKCPTEARGQFYPDLQRALGSAFTPRLSTNMNLIVMGDSLGIQLSVLFQEVASNGSSLLLGGNRVVLDCYPSMQRCTRVVYTLSRAQGGGTIAGWRITNMLKEIGLTKNLPQLGRGGGWRLEMVEQMKNFSWDTPPVSESPNRTTTTNSTVIGSFDVMFFRIPQIWMSLDEVQHETLRETVEQAAKSFGVKTVIFMDLPIVNGYVKTTALVAANQRVRSFVDQWQHNRTDNSLTNVFLLELGTFMISVGTKNAEHLGYNTSQPDFIAELVPYDKKKYKSSAAINCLMMPSIDAKFGNYTATCPLNMLFNDGLHMCTETLGPRIVAGVGCLVNCASLDPSHHADCDRVCNQEHMQLDMEKTAPVSER